MPANRNTQHAPSMKTECDNLNGWIKKRSHTQTLTKIVNPRDIAGDAEEEEEEEEEDRHILTLKNGSGVKGLDKF